MDTNHHRFLVGAVALPLAIIAGGCQTTKNRAAKRSSGKHSVEKLGSKSSPATTYDLAEAGNAHADDALSNERLLEVYAELNAPPKELSATALQTLEKIPTAPAAGSTQEAVAVLGVLHKSLNQRSSAPAQYEEADLYHGNSNHNAATATTSLETLARQKQINLGEAMKSNPLLKNYNAYQLAELALEKTPNSPEYAEALRKTISEQMQAWRGQNGTATTASGAAPAGDNVSMNLSAADFRSGDALLVEAQSLADNRRYSEAIRKARLIDESSPLFEAARGKIVVFSNDAVQELREKAAQAFQNAMPISDPKARHEYLEKAKLHLEEALNSYPNAPAQQLSTVRENLAVIGRNLERVDPDASEFEAQ